MERDKEYEALPNMDDHACFGCSPVNPSGLQMKFYSKGDTVFSWVTVPEHLCGWRKLVHGGVISTILDEISSRAVIYSLRVLCLTKSLEVRFLKPIYVGSPIRAEGRVLEVRDREVVTYGAIFDEKEGLCAESTGIVTRVSLERVKQMCMADEGTLRFFEGLFGGGE